jgi:hypothetical protein
MIIGTYIPALRTSLFVIFDCDWVKAFTILIDDAVRISTKSVKWLRLSAFDGTMRSRGYNNQQEAAKCSS